MKDMLRPVSLAAAPLGGLFSLAGAILLWSLARGSGSAGMAWAGLFFCLAGLALLAGGLFLIAHNRERALSSHLNTLEHENAQLAGHAHDLEVARRESDVVLSSVRGHLMLIDPSYFIQSRYSNELEEVFHQKTNGNENLLNVFQRLLSDRMFKTARDYLSLLFDASKKERTVLKVNPLDEVEVDVSTPGGPPTLKHLHFDFRRIIEGGVISRVLVTVEDVSDRTTLERQLRDSENQKVRQFELLIGILHVEPRALDGFVQLANGELARVDEALKASDFSSATVGQTALLRQRLDLVLQRIHNIKGNAQLLRLEHFEIKAQEFEQKVIDLKYRGALGGDDFLALVIALADFRSDLDSLQTLRVKLAGIQRAVEIREEVGDDLVTDLRMLASTLAKKAGKEVRIDAHGFDSRSLPPEKRFIVKDVLIQLTRNSLAHGVEAPAEREAANKAPVATIDIHPAPDTEAGTFAFTYRDDGRGLDAERIKKRALELGLLAADRADEVDDSEIASFIFAPGFSTADQASLEAGRGMGMNVIKERVVDQGGGEITVNSVIGTFCEFSFVLPLGAKFLAAAR
jgi:two-component system chemotaxis sensor kinase CheA